MSVGIAPSSARPSRLLSYGQLLRIPNVFTAVADIAMAALVTASLPDHITPFLFLVLASSCLYCAGMVWNDYFDFDQDLRERPFRPVPSNRISRATAARLAAFLSAAGIAFAVLAGVRGDHFDIWPVVVALLLIVAILLYDSWLKRTF